MPASLLKTFANGVGETVPVILELLDYDNIRVAAARVEESDVLRLEDAADAARAAPVVLDVEGDELLDPAGAVVRAGTVVVVDMIPVLLDHVAASTLVPIAVAKDDASLLKTCVTRVGGAVPVIPEMAADVNTLVVDSLDAENEVLLLELAANTDVEGLVPPAVLVNAVFATVEGSEGSVFDTLAVLEVDGDEIVADVNTSVAASRVADDEVLLLEAAVDADVEGLMSSALLVNAVSVAIEGSEGSGLATLAVLEVDIDELPDSAGTAVLVGVGADVAMIPMVIGNAGACERMLSAVADAEDNAPLLKTFVHGVGQTVPGILEVFEHVNTRVAAALVPENDVILLEAAAEVIAEVLVPPAVLVKVVSVTVEGSGVPEHVAPAALVVLDAESDELLDSAGAEAWAGTGVVDVMIPVMLDHVDARAIVPIAVADEDAPPPKTCVNREGGVVPVIPEMAADFNTSVVASRVAEDEVLLLEAAAKVDGKGLMPLQYQRMPSLPPSRAQGC